MDNILETDKLKYIEFNKGYVEGSNQFKIFISDSAPITNVPIENYWQSQIVYNITIDKIYQFLENVDNSKPHLKDDPILDTIIYGKDGLVDKLKPYQNKYNTIKNKMYDYIRRCSEAMVIVEDGSIDVDSLEEEGLAPGKILVYRQGANTPTTETEEFNNYLYEAMKEQCQYLETQMRNVIYYFCNNLDNIIDKALKDETNDEVLKYETNNEE